MNHEEEDSASIKRNKSAYDFYIGKHFEQKKHISYATCWDKRTNAFWENPQICSDTFI